MTIRYITDEKPEQRIQICVFGRKFTKVWEMDKEICSNADGKIGGKLLDRCQSKEITVIFFGGERGKWLYL